MAIIRAYTDLSQSKTLSKILPLESADMWYQYTGISIKDGSEKPIYFPMAIRDDESDKDIPCWSLAALISILPRFIEFKDDKYYLRFMKDYVEYANDEVSITGRCLHTTGNNNLVDASYEMILKLHEHKMLNKC